jgi:rSAM/selenodomain-associated transferase 1
MTMDKGMAKDRLLILFYRNPELGKVKTRLSASIGEEKALAVYYLLSHQTKNVTATLRCDKILCYTDFIDTEDSWPSAVYLKSLQQGADLGERMMFAFQSGFERKYKSICIIGMDCFELTSAILEKAFEKLTTHEIVIGPAKDGGYYLLGMNHPHPELFQNKKWSSDSVAADTLSDCEKLKLNVFKLPTLADVDRENDLPEAIRKSLQLL